MTATESGLAKFYRLYRYRLDHFDQIGEPFDLPAPPEVP